VNANDHLLSRDERAPHETPRDEAAAEESRDLDRHPLILCLSWAEGDGVRPARRELIVAIDHRARHVAGHDQLDGIDL
jgi:hypothetical protein